LRYDACVAVDERVTQVGPAEDVNADLGFGAVVARESRARLLNRDGSFNVRRTGLRVWESLSVYHYFLTLSWPRFLSFVALAYVTANAIFGAVYVLLGHGALAGAEHLDDMHRYAKAFFFSVHTLATIGYGNVVPATLSADVVVTIESLVGILGFSVVAGIVFARFARPVARIVFSKNAVIAPYRGGRAFMFRIVNQRSTQLVQLEARVLLARRRVAGARTADREFVQLDLERERVVFFPLAWTIVHPIEENSPLRDWTAEDLRECDAEFLILLNGFDETFSQTVHARSSYKVQDVVWGARFASMFNPPEEGVVSVDIRKLDDLERATV
jgi:inward rectifier potassium channel